MTSPRRRPEPRTPRPAASFIPHPQPSEEDLLELREPYELPTPEYPDPCWLARRPDYVIVICETDWARDRFPATAARLWDALRTGSDRHHHPGPDLEAEP